MYKKITHHIVEEHFDHPIAAELQKKVDKNKATATIDYRGRVLDPVTGKPLIDPTTGDFVYADTNVSKAKLKTNKKVIPPKKPKGYEIYSYDFSPLSLIEKRSLNRWACLSWRIRSLVISITEGDDDIDLLKARMANDISKISEIVSEAYGEEAATAFDKLLNDVTLALVDVLMLVKADEDTTEAMTKMADANKALGDFLESANKSWPSKAVVDIFTQVENLYIMQAISRIKKEWAAGVAAADNAYDIMVVQQDNGDPSFADIFSKGIIEYIEQSLETEIANDLSDYLET